MNGLVESLHRFRRTALATLPSMDILGAHAAGRGDQIAYIEDGRPLTWEQMFELRNRLANSLIDLGFQAGEHAVVYSHNSVEMVLSGAAARACGGVPVPINPRLVAEEVAYILDDSDAALVFVQEDLLPVIEEVRAQATKVRNWVSIGSPAPGWAESFQGLIAAGSDGTERLDFESLGGSMVYTSGTTGKPKGARRGFTDPALWLRWIQAFDLADSNHIHLVAGPLYHSAPAAFAGFAQLAGSTSVIMRKFDPEHALRLIEEHRCTATFMAPTLLKRIVDLPEEVKSRYDVSSMKVIVVAGAPCPAKVKEEVFAHFGPILYEFYGASELSVTTLMRPEDMLRKPASCGRAAPGMELAILDRNGRPVPAGTPGELFVRRHAGMFDGYYKNSEATEQAVRGDWVSVGDIAYIDEEGFVFICDRRTDMIISGGVNIYPAEIEDVLFRHPRVADAGVFGVPDEDWGERVHAAIQTKPGESVSPEELISFCRKHLAGYKVPREFSFHDDFPRDNAGKLRKRVLREPYWAGRETRV